MLNGEGPVGPDSGTVTLPWHIGWGPHYAYDLADEADLLLMYERVIREAQAAADLRSYLNPDLLRRHWNALFLPAPARTAWQARLPHRRTPRRPDPPEPSGAVPATAGQPATRR